jgi:hypothetical protein
MSRGRLSWRRFTVVGLFVMTIISGSACGQRAEGDEPTKYQSQAGLEKLTQQAAQRSKQASAQSGPVNSRFSSAKNITAASPTSKDIDSIIRPVLVKQFGDARLLSAAGPEKPKIDGEVVEDRLLYSVRTVLTEAAGDKLHAAFRAVGFVTSPRLGSKPTHGRTKVLMSLFRSTSLRGYSFVIIVDMSKQQIEVESYKLGSKYDRLM